MEQQGVPVSTYLVLRLLAQNGYGRRKMRKVNTGCNSRFRFLAEKPLVR